MDVKKVLVEIEGDMEKVVDVLCEKGVVKVEKKSGWVVVEGIVVVVIKDNKVVIVEINCEIDLVVLIDKFKNLVIEVVDKIVEEELVFVDDVLVLKMVNGMVKDDVIEMI